MKITKPKIPKVPKTVKPEKASIPKPVNEQKQYGLKNVKKPRMKRKVYK